jgi:hypothetical protein
MVRTEAPNLLQFLRKQAKERGDVIDGQDPHRQLRILLENQAAKAGISDSKRFGVVESLYPPLTEDLAGK